MSVKPVPEGYHTVTPYLIIRDAAAAIDFYAKAFGAEERVRMPGPDGKVMHGEVKIGDSMVMLGEENLDRGARSPQTLGGSASSIMLYVPDVDAAFERAVAAGCTVRMPVSDMFWGDRFGTLSDPYGHEWSMATHVEDLSPEEMERRMAATMPGG